jgi:hypothetical protein
MIYYFDLLREIYTRDALSRGAGSGWKQCFWDSKCIELDGVLVTWF